jgi:hypothetical protein
MVENGGHGGSTAAPIARKVTDYWLLGKLPKPIVPEGEAANSASDEIEDNRPADARFATELNASSEPDKPLQLSSPHELGNAE